MPSSRRCLRFAATDPASRNPQHAVAAMSLEHPPPCPARLPHPSKSPVHVVLARAHPTATTMARFGRSAVACSERTHEPSSMSARMRVRVFGSYISPAKLRVFCPLKTQVRRGRGRGQDHPTPSSARGPPLHALCCFRRRFPPASRAGACMGMRASARVLVCSNWEREGDARQGTPTTCCNMHMQPSEALELLCGPPRVIL